MTMHDPTAAATANETPTHAPSPPAATASPESDASTPRTLQLQPAGFPLRSQSLTQHRAPLRTHSRSASAASGHRKRLSLSFPILPPATATPRSIHQSPFTASPVSASPVSSPPPYQRGSIAAAADVSPADSAAFLTALASQERRVLELREELGKAESELGRLKKQWAVHEASRKRHELSSSLNSAFITGEAGAAGLTSPTSREEYQLRRKATLSSAQTAGGPPRKILPSQRHQRTLSLVSSHPPKPAPPPTSAPAVHPPKRPVSGSFAVPMVPQPSTPVANPRPLSLTSDPKRHSQDALLRVAEGFKEGLWTFIQDIREATVGDDINTSPQSAPAPAPVSRTNSMRRTSSGTSVSSLGRAAGKKPAHKPAPKESSLIDFDHWEDHAEPASASTSTSNRWSTSTTLSDAPSFGVATPPSRASTPRTSTSSAASFYKTPADYTNGGGTESPLWTTAMQLKKSANAFMSQVERSLEIAIPSAVTGADVDVEAQMQVQAGAGTAYKSADRAVGVVRTRSRKGSPVKRD